MDGHGAATAEMDPEHEGGEHIHLPGPSVWPFALAFFLFLAMIGMLFFPHYRDANAGAGQWLAFIIISAIGAIGVAVSIIMWGLQISEA